MEESKALESKEITKSAKSSRVKTLECAKDEVKDQNKEEMSNIEGRKIIKIKRRIESKREENEDSQPEQRSSLSAKPEETS